MVNKKLNFGILQGKGSEEQGNEEVVVLEKRNVVADARLRGCRRLGNVELIKSEKFAPRFQVLRALLSRGEQILRRFSGVGK